MCDIVCEAGADYIKTSTGFSTAGANFHDVELMVKACMAAARSSCRRHLHRGGYGRPSLRWGADRLGTSRAVKILNGEQAKGY